MSDITEDFLFDGPQDAALTLVLAHGAGLGMAHPFMQFFAEAAARAGYRAVRFDFDYMARMKREQRRRPPDPGPKLLERWKAVVEALGGPGRLVLGGKSMGGRIAAATAKAYCDAGQAPAGFVGLGFPFHAPGKPEGARLDDLKALAIPGLILQGERDPFGTKEEVDGYNLPEGIEVLWSPFGDHHLAPLKSSGLTVEQNWEAAGQALVTYLRACEARL